MAWIRQNLGPTLSGPFRADGSIPDANPGLHLGLSHVAPLGPALSGPFRADGLIPDVNPGLHPGLSHVAPLGPANAPKGLMGQSILDANSLIRRAIRLPQSGKMG